MGEPENHCQPEISSQHTKQECLLCELPPTGTQPFIQPWACAEVHGVTQDSLAAPQPRSRVLPCMEGHAALQGAQRWQAEGVCLPVLLTELMEVGQSFCSAEPFGRLALRCHCRSQLVICAAQQPHRSEANEFNTYN